MPEYLLIILPITRSCLLWNLKLAKESLRVKQKCLPMLGKQVFKNQLVILNTRGCCLPFQSSSSMSILYLLCYDTFFQLS